MSLATGAMLSIIACQERGAVRSEVGCHEPVFGAQASAMANLR
jgi:hypothetical protein